MSQFKSRLPGSLLFTTDRGADQGYCCNRTGDGGYTGSTRYECFLKNGFFIPASSEIEAKNKCPKVQKGTCCKYNSTTRALISSDTGVTYCNCSTLNPTANHPQNSATCNRTSTCIKSRSADHGLTEQASL